MCVLCSYIFDTLTKVKGLDEIYVYCSDEKIQEYLPEGIKFGEMTFTPASGVGKWTTEEANVYVGKLITL